MLKQLQELQNVDFEGYAYFEEQEAVLPVFTLMDIPADEWNRRARINNTEAFIREHRRMPDTYEEVRSWIDSLIAAPDPTPILSEETIKSLLQIVSKATKKYRLAENGAAESITIR
ncbi:hypothetical protein D1B31_22060 [Neobacillus notoginsengisoli]|uniref:Uncharacterized protein n=1 Tax=Neobacillus notoginsengisoli TaxID=1578198 RepID=A0A417YFF6_9BACI|nr:hypothetical protein [Neobacillus notoginsengisoli]RHW31494.1 hypothetical protein D1B31_22060 [Neobacillus notoginsengisoli]